MYFHHFRQPYMSVLSLICIGLLFSGCGAPGPTRTEAIALEELPAEIGRGFPLATLEQIDNSNSGIERGKPAPNFALVLADGRYLELADLQGRPILLNFWATWCGPCRLEMPEIVAEAKQNEELVVLAINVQEDLAQLEGFANDFQMTMPVVQDADGLLRNLYAVSAMPTSVFIDREGNIATVWAGILNHNKLEELVADIQQ